MEVPEVPPKFPAECSPRWQCQFVMSEMFDKNLSFLKEVFPWKKNQGEKRNQLCFETSPHSVIFILRERGMERGGFHGHEREVLVSFPGKRWHFEAGDFVWGLQIFLLWWFLWTALSSGSNVALKGQLLSEGTWMHLWPSAEILQAGLRWSSSGCRCWCLQGSDTQHQPYAQAAFISHQLLFRVAGRENSSLWSSSVEAELLFHRIIRSSRLQKPSEIIQSNQHCQGHL